ncbi:hypothetical protein MPH_03009 [Macrophomina phaseolina MS6]|uniref:GST N-terminal domain-containing protein n=1 Tax=Macrophomina phaseolina (strain MS6) TaxID=1126212 RepID=K2RY64_MACPH|nr:hypothetical protein MPH_03009 [Macrophomina phaseolina MS6]
MRYLLALAAIEFQRVNQPPVLPRPDLQELGITHRRIPVLAIGKDIYCDTAAITKVVQQKLGSVPAGPAEKAFEAFGARLFDSMLHVVPATVLTETFKRDRETIFRGCFNGLGMRMLLMEEWCSCVEPSRLRGDTSELPRWIAFCLGHNRGRIPCARRRVHRRRPAKHSRRTYCPFGQMGPRHPGHWRRAWFRRE